MKLLMNPGSPFSRKVRILARERGLAERIEEVIVKVSPAEVEVDADLVRANPLAQIPVLVLGNGMALYDSSVICDYLDRLGIDGETLSPSGPAPWPALRVQALCDGLITAAVLCRYEAALRPVSLRWDAWVDGHRQKIARGLAELAVQCEAWQDTFGRPQIGAVCVLGYLDFRFPEWPWRDSHPLLARWFSQTSNRASVLQTVPT